ncbi:MAG: dihydroorotase [Flavobacteriales bacterium]
MKVLLKSARITDVESPHNNTNKDILITNGLIENIATSISDPDAIILSVPELHVSQGWVDLKAAFFDPGFEERGGLAQGLDDAALGGFTHVGALPSDNPSTDTKLAVEYKRRMADGHCVQLHPIGAITKQQKGKELAALFEMFQAGALWFSDDQHPINEGILTRALLYTRDFGGHIIFTPRSTNFALDAQVHEGMGSTRTGLKGDPALDERLQIIKAIEIAAYTNSSLHITGISSKDSIAPIQQAKANGLAITCDVNLMNLCFTEHEILDFDTRFKVLPVLRADDDRLALIQAISQGVIDGIVTDHRPYVLDDKQVAFDEAAFGAPQLLTAYSALLNHTGISSDTLIEHLSIKNRKLFGIASNPIQTGSMADLTCYTPTISWELDESAREKACNPFVGKPLTGRAIGVINNGIVMLNQPDYVG